MAAEVYSSRRDRFGHRKEGTGRTASARHFDIRGPRTGWQPPTNVERDADGFEDIDTFFGAAAGGSSTATGTTALPSKRIDFGGSTGTANAASPGGGAGMAAALATSSPLTGLAGGAKALMPTVASVDEDGALARFADMDAYGGGMDDGGLYQGGDAYAAAPGPRAGAGGGGRGTAVGSKRDRAAAGLRADGGGKTKKGEGGREEEAAADAGFRRKKAASKAGRKAAVAAASSGDADVGDDDDDKENAYKTPQYSKIRQSLGVGHGEMTEDGRPQRRRWRPLAHWKGERILYQDGMGAVVAEKLGVPTPEAEGKRKAQPKAAGGRPRAAGRDDSRSRSASRSQSAPRTSKGGKLRRADEDRNVGDRGRDDSHVATLERDLEKALTKLEMARRGTRAQAPFPASSLPSGFQEADSATMVVAASGGHPAYKIAVVRERKNLTFEELPITTKRPKSMSIPALAAAAFDAPQFISGIVQLKPRSMKDEESTHNCTQVFFVQKCQPKSLEVSIMDNRYLLSPGDQFFVPMGTLYRLTNHSSDTDAEIGFIVIKPSAME